MHKRPCFWKPFRSERVNESQKLMKPAENYFHPTFASFWSKLSDKKGTLVKSQILGLLVNTFTTDNECSCSNMENLPEPIQGQLFEKPKPFSQFFITILKFTLNLEHFT